MKLANPFKKNVNDITGSNWFFSDRWIDFGCKFFIAGLILMIISVTLIEIFT